MCAGAPVEYMHHMNDLRSTPRVLAAVLPGMIVTGTSARVSVLMWYERADFFTKSCVSS